MREQNLLLNLQWICVLVSRQHHEVVIETTVLALEKAFQIPTLKSNLLAILTLEMHCREGEWIAGSFPKLWHWENRFTQMQRDTTLTQYALGFVSCWEQRWIKQESMPFGITPHLQWGQLLSKTNSIGWSALSISSSSLLLLEEPKELWSYSSFHKAAEGWNQLPTMLSSNILNPSARTKNKLRSLSAVSQIDFPLASYSWLSSFSAICTSQSHRLVQSPTMKLVTFLGGNYKGGVHIEWLIQRDKCPTQPIGGILLLPALPDICLLYQDAESSHGSAPPSSCQHRKAQESAERNKVFSHDQWLTGSIAASWPTSTSKTGLGLIFMNLLQRWRLWRSCFPLSGSEALRLGWEGFMLSAQVPEKMVFEIYYLLRLWSVFCPSLNQESSHSSNMHKALTGQWALYKLGSVVFSNSLLLERSLWSK